jgi:hypothetical protein
LIDVIIINFIIIKNTTINKNNQGLTARVEDLGFSDHLAQILSTNSG